MWPAPASGAEEGPCRTTRLRRQARISVLLSPELKVVDRIALPPTRLARPAIATAAKRRTGRRGVSPQSPDVSRYFGSLWPLAAKASPNAFLAPPPAGFT